MLNHLKCIAERGKAGDNSAHIFTTAWGRNKIRRDEKEGSTRRREVRKGGKYEREGSNEREATREGGEVTREGGEVTREGGGVTREGGEVTSRREIVLAPR